MAEVEQYEETHAIGTKPRLALALLLYTGTRRSDVVRLGRQHVRAGLITFTAQKKINRKPVTIEVPMLPVLRSIIDASPTGDLTYLVTDHGQPFTPAGFGGWFREQCDKAGLKHCSAHGLRKAGASIAAENGASAHQLMAIFGWLTLIRTFEGHSSSVLSVAFSPDGTRVLSGSGDNTIKLWDAATGVLIRTFEGHAASVNSVAFSPDGGRILSGSEDNTIKLWDAATGALIRTFEGHSWPICPVAFSPDGARVLSGSDDGTVSIWKLATGERLASLVSGKRGEWLSITPAGFFTASRKSTELLSVVQGSRVAAIDQVWQSLFNPDLVRETLAGDPVGEVREAAKVINLEKVLDSGPAPLVEIISPASGNKSDAELVNLSVRVTDRGKGIGRIEWRVNGITVGVNNAPVGVGPIYEVKRELALDPGENAIEVVAYNARNLLASLPAQTTIAYTGPTGNVKPNLYILAIGINKYADPDLALDFAAADATFFAQEMKKAGEGLYGEGKGQVRIVLDEQATRSGLDRIVQEIAADIQPRDTFVLFAAAHGYSDKKNGRFYLIPQDYQGDDDPEALARGAIGQDALQDWIANRIKAKKAIILLDTCRSGALISGYTRSRIDERPSEAAVGRLHEATGRPVLTAAAAGEKSFEDSTIGHGIFTTALIDALHYGDKNGDGLIEVSELADYVEEHVPKLADGSEVHAAFTPRGAGDSDRQSAHFATRPRHQGQPLGGCLRGW